MGCEQSAPVVDNGKITTATIPVCCSHTVKSGFTYTKNTCALEYWEPLRLLGEGSISSIHLVRRRPHRVDVPYTERADIMRVADTANIKAEETMDTSELFALKSIMKDHVRNDQYLKEMRSEIYTMSRLCHVNIVSVVEAYERKRHIYLIMEKCDGGDLCERKPTEPEAAVIVRKVLSAVAYMHQHNVVHRDLKLENIMFDKDPSDPSAEIKIIDFGLATKFLSNEYKVMTARVGTLYSMAPQVLQGVYDAKCDLWSVGVVAYMLLSGGLNPFWGPPREISWDQRKKIMIDRIMRCEYMKMRGPSWDNISPEAKAFVQTLIQMNPKRRPTAATAIQSEWIVKYKDYQPKSMPAQDQQYAKKLELKRSAKVLFAQDLPEEQIVQLKNALEQKDPKKEDRVSILNFRNTLLQSPVLQKAKVESLFDGKDLDMDETINYVGMLNDALDRRMRKHEEFIVNIFSQCDTDASCCKISKEKLRGLLAESFEAKNASFVSPLYEIIDQVDESGGGVDGGNSDISCQAIVDRIRQLEMERMHNISSCSGDGRELFPHEQDDSNGGGLTDLVDENNAWIPGGRSHDPHTTPKFIYDDHSKSVRKYREGEDGDDISESLSTS